MFKTAILSLSLFFLILNDASFSANRNNQQILTQKRINIYKKKLSLIILKSNSRNSQQTLLAVTQAEKLINELTKFKAKSIKYYKLLLFYHQITAGIYLHRLKMPLQAIKHYNTMLNHPYFIKKGRPIVKWIIYEGLGLSYYIKKHLKKALSFFNKALFQGKIIYKINMIKGMGCIQSSSYNSATIYARLNKKSLALKFLKLSIKSCINYVQKKRLINMAKKEKDFISIRNSREFKAILR